MTEQANRLIKTIKQMETSLDDTRTKNDEDSNLRVTYPLLRCLQTLKQKHATISKLHRERFEQVKREFCGEKARIDLEADIPCQRTCAGARVLLFAPRTILCPH